MPERQYSDEEVRAIIDRALASEPDRAISHEQLVSIGADVGLSRTAIENAAREVEEKRELTRARERILQRRRKQLASHAWAYALVNAFLFALNYLTTPGDWWVLFPLLGWALGLAFHARAGLSKDVSDRAIARELRRIQHEARLLETHAAPANQRPNARVRITSDAQAPQPVENEPEVERDADQRSRKGRS